MQKYSLWFLIALFILGFTVRLYRFDNPVADWHSFRQSDTNAVSARFADEGINLLYPKYFDISNVQSGLDNPEGFRFVEFPIYNALQAALHKYVGILTLPEWGRLLTIFSSLAVGLFIFLLTKKYANAVSGFFALIFFLFLPFSIFYGRSILPDTHMVAAIFGSMYFFDRWLSSDSKSKKKSNSATLFDRKNLYYFLAILLCAASLLLKPFAIFFIFPLFYLSYTRFGIGMFLKWQLWLFAALSLAPFIGWRYWIANFPEGIPASSWLFNGNGIRFRPAFFRWIFYERITGLIMGMSGLIFLVLGSISVLKLKNKGFFMSLALSVATYLFVIATGNVQHDYYQIFIMPVIAIFAGLGASWLYEKMKSKSNSIFALSICSILIVVSIYFSWIKVRDYFNINDRGMVAAGIKANEILPPDAIIIAPYDGSTTLLNIASRRGWPVFQKSIEELIDSGATYMVIANPTINDLEGFGRSYERVAESKEYLILRLKDTK